MNMEKGLICLLIVTMLTLCVPNVAIASTSKLATGTHIGYATNVKGQQQTLFNITLAYPVGGGEYITNVAITTNVTQPVELWGYLGYAPDMQGRSNPIGGATVNIQASLDGNTWTPFFTTTTMTGTYIGGIKVQLTPHSTEVCYYRFTYDGDSQYAPCVSDVVQLTIVNSAQ